MSTRTLLIDGDFVAWSIAHVPGDVARRTVSYVERLMRDLLADRAIVCLGDPSHRYFRHDLLPTYKASRSEPPAELFTVFDALQENFTCRWLDGLEADDVLGILATCEGLAGERVIVGIDKDLHTIPGTHLNPRKEPRGIVRVSDRDAAFNHLWQTIVGDSSDGFPGLPGVGPKGARRILWGEPSLWWKQVVMAFKSKGRAEADALLQARVARILRSCDYDLDARRVIPWTPDRVLSQVAEVSHA